MVNKNHWTLKKDKNEIKILTKKTGEGDMYISVSVRLSASDHVLKKGERKRQEKEEEEQRRKVSRGREIKSKTRIPQTTNVYDPCTAEVNQRESN